MQTINQFIDKQAILGVIAVVASAADSVGLVFSKIKQTAGIAAAVVGIGLFIAPIENAQSQSSSVLIVSEVILT